MVSTNNTCRSFIAESLLRQLLLDAHQKNIEVISRGLVVLFPEPVHVKAADMVIQKCGIESLDFQSAQLTQEEVEQSDLILTMTEEQKEKKARYDPSVCRERTSGSDVPDREASGRDRLRSSL